MTLVQQGQFKYKWKNVDDNANNRLGELVGIWTKDPVVYLILNQYDIS